MRKRTDFLWLFVFGLLFSVGCASYDYAQNVKLISFTHDITKGQSIGNIRGEDCTMIFLGYYLGGFPTVDRAFINARSQANSIHAAGFDFKNEGRGTASLKYVTNVTTQQEGFNAFVVGKTCLVVTGVGYQ